MAGEADLWAAVLGVVGETGLWAAWGLTEEVLDDADAEFEDDLFVHLYLF